MNLSKNGACDATIIVQTMFDTTLYEFAREGKRAFVLWQMRDRPTIATLLQRLKISRALLYREYGDLLTWEHITFNWHPYIRGGFKTSPWLREADCEGCGGMFTRYHCIFVQNIETRHELPTMAYHSACLKAAGARARRAYGKEPGILRGRRP